MHERLIRLLLQCTSSTDLSLSLSLSVFNLRFTSLYAVGLYLAPVPSRKCEEHEIAADGESRFTFNLGSCFKKCNTFSRTDDDVSEAITRLWLPEYIGTNNKGFSSFPRWKL